MGNSGKLVEGFSERGETGVQRGLLHWLMAGMLLGGARGAVAAKTPPPDHWVGTWAAAPVGVANDKGQFGAADTTYREIVHVSLGGPLLRVALSNEFGQDPLTIGAAHVALRAQADGVQLTSANALTFGGKPSVVIPPGATVVSDEASVSLKPFADLAISIFVPAQPMRMVSTHVFADQTSYRSDGDEVTKASLTAPQTIDSWPFLKGVAVKVPAEDAAVVCFGDSITDGAASTKNENQRWPDLLATRLAGNKGTKRLGVLNQGIGGNRILHDGFGPNALARFDRDVLAQPAAKYVVLLEGINDIGNATGPNNPHDVVTADDLIQGFGILAARAHQRGLKVIGATITPFVGAGYQSDAGEAIRQAVNTWIRTTKDLDGVVDFDKATQDPAHPERFSAEADSGDHLHPKDGGYRRMADAFDLKLFEVNPKEKYDIRWFQD